MRTDAHGRSYYVDHNTRTTTWERPQPLPPGLVSKQEGEKKEKYFLFENILIINFVLTYFNVRLYFDTLRYGTNSENMINLPSPHIKKC